MGKRYCFQGDEISCPAANVLGFKELPKKLKEGRGLVGFGIVDKQKQALKCLKA